MTDTIPATVKTHTALPYLRDGALVYALCEDGQVNRISIRIDGGFVGYRKGRTTDAELIATAEFIVRACNSHYQLVSALREAIEELWDRDYSSMDRIQFERANASLFTALSQAGGE